MTELTNATINDEVNNQEATTGEEAMVNEAIDNHTISEDTEKEADNLIDDDEPFADDNLDSSLDSSDDEELFDDEEEALDVDENDEDDLNLKNLLNNAVSSTIQSTEKLIGEAGVMSVVNAKTGNRVTFPAEVMGKLGDPTAVQIAYTPDCVFVGEKLPNNESCFNIKRKDDKAKGIIYNATLVNEITNRYNLNFSDRTSITFPKAKYCTHEGHPVAVIKVRYNS